MPAKVYLDSPPHGDFRAMPARGDGLALLKWVTSFPGNSAKGLPVVRGEVLLSDAETGEELAVIECSSVTSLRTGAAAAVSAQVLAAEGAKSVGIIGCGVNGAWAARCLAAAGYGPGVCADPRVEPAEALADELGWRAGDRGEAAAQDVVVTVTPGERAGDPRGRPAAGPAPRGARRRRPRQAGGRPGGDRALPPLLRRVGAGERRRRARQRGRRRTGERERRDPARRRPDRRAGAAAQPTRSRSSTRPAWRSRTWRSARRSTSAGGTASVEAPVVTL